MSRRVAAVSLLVAGAASLIPYGASADDGDLLASTAATSDETVGAIEVAAAVESYGGQQAVRAAPTRPLCTWAVFVPPITPSAGGAAEIAFAQAAANDSTLYTKTCPTASGTVSTFALVPDRISVEDLITSAATRVRAQIPSPELNISPPPEVGGTVNVGMWLAVDDPGQVSITASVGPVWATITAAYDRTVWDFGNDDRVECRGIGVPIVDLDLIEEGPCGYTYRAPSAPEFTGTDDLAYHAAVTGYWTITYATSSGSTGSLDPIGRMTEFLYQVREIQTLRVAEGG